MRTLRSPLVRSLPSLLLLVACGGHQNPREASIERWADNHPEASRELGVWVRTHQQAGPVFFEWDSQHPARAQQFVIWTVRHPSEPIEAFTSTHPRWPGFEKIMETHRPATQAFMDWCRRHPAAAEALMRHPGGLHWAGHHIFKAEWHLEQR